MTEVVPGTEKKPWHWKDCADSPEELKKSWPKEEPKEPEVGQGWYDEKAGALCVWDGVEWTCIPTD